MDVFDYASEKGTATQQKRHVLLYPLNLGNCKIKSFQHLLESETLSHANETCVSSFNNCQDGPIALPLTFSFSLLFADVRQDTRN